MSKIEIYDAVTKTSSVRDLNSSEQTEFDNFQAATAGANDPRTILENQRLQKEADRASGITKLKALGLTQDEATAIATSGT